MDRDSLSPRSSRLPLLAVALLSMLPLYARSVPAAQAPTDAGGMLYEVEMVVFRASRPPAGEDWNVIPPGRGFGAGTGRPPQTPDIVRVLAPSEYRLDGVVSRLRGSGEWYPIAHAAWVQTAPPWGNHVGLPLSGVDIDVPGLTGTVYLERAPLYLHLGFDVSLQSLNGTGTYTINEMRNVRQNERQYFDHPAFGVIALARPLKKGDR